MARDAKSQAKKTYQEGQDTYNTAAGNANTVYGQLFPQYKAEATNSQGFAPIDLAAMNTAVNQSTGGSVGGVVGEGNLMAARTRNPGGYMANMDEATRQAIKARSMGALNIQNENAKLREMNRQAGLAGEAGLWQGDVNELLASLGAQNQSTNALTQAGQSGWFQNFMNLVNTMGGAAKTASGIANPPSSGGG